MALLTRVLVALSLCALIAACGGVPDPDRGRDVDGLEILRPALSPDGRFMVFDFYERGVTAEGQRWETSHHLALYDIEVQSVVVMAPNDPMYSYNSASFAGDERMLVAIQYCRSRACPPEDLGHQVVLLDLEGQRSRRLTDGRKRSYLWRGAQHPHSMTLSEFDIARARPVFVPSEFAVYYMASFSSSMLGPVIDEHWPVTHQLMRVDLETEEESLVMPREPDPVAFRMLGRVAAAGEGHLVFSGRPIGGGVVWDGFHKIRATAFSLDLETKRLTPLFPDPPYFDETSQRPLGKRFSFWPRSLTSSADGRRIAFVDRADGPEFESVWLFEDGVVKEPFEPKSYGFNRVSGTALSADGRWLAALDLHMNRHFLLMDLDSGQVQQLPLRAPLRQALEEAKRNTQARTK